MEKPVHITIPADIVREIEQYREVLKKKIGFKPKFSDTIRHLVRKGLKRK